MSRRAPSGRRLPILAGLLAIALMPSPLRAQSDTLVAAAGDRVRLWVGSPESSVDGTLLDSGAPGWIWLLSSRDTVRIEQQGIARLEVARPRNKRVGTKALIGAGVGFLGGFVLGVATESDSQYLNPSPEEAGLAVGVAGAIFGGLVGVLVGVSGSGTAWHPGQLPGD